MVRCAIWYHLYNFKNVKNTLKSVTFSKVGVFFSIGVFHVFKLYKSYKITQNITIFLAVRYPMKYQPLEYILRHCRQTKRKTKRKTGKGACRKGQRGRQVRESIEKKALLIYYSFNVEVRII